MVYELIMDGHLGGCVRGGDPDTWDVVVWDNLIDRYKISSLIDVGCGEGWSTKYFYDRGVDVLGVEGSQLVVDGSPNKEIIIQHDYTKGRLTLPKKYQSIWSCEFVEHVEEKYVDNFLDTFKQVDFIFMTYSEPQWSSGGHHHVNCQNQEYWNDRLSDIGFRWDKNASYDLRQIATARWVKPTLSVYIKN